MVAGCSIGRCFDGTQAHRVSTPVTDEPCLFMITLALRVQAQQVRTAGAESLGRRQLSAVLAAYPSTRTVTVSEDDIVGIQDDCFPAPPATTMWMSSGVTVIGTIVSASPSSTNRGWR